MNHSGIARRFQFRDALWYSLVILAAIVVLASVPAYIRQLGKNSLIEQIQLSVIAPGFSPAGPTEYWLDLANMLVQLVSSLACIGLAVLIFRQKPHEPVAPFVAIFLILFGVLMTGPLQTLSEYNPVWFPIIGRAEALLFAVWALIFTIFPDGQFYPLWTRYLALAFLPWAVITLAFRDFFSPLTAPPAGQIMVVFLWYMIWPVTTLVAQILRFRQHSPQLARQQTKWVVFGFLIFVSVMFTMFLILLLQFATRGNQGFQAGLFFLVRGYGLIWYLLVSFVPLTMGVAILRFHLWEIDFILNRTLVYLTLTSLVLVIYIGLVEGIGILFNASANLLISLVATGLVAVLFQPLRERMQRLVNQLMYGKRDDPYSVLSSLNRRLQNTLSPQSVLPVVVETIAVALKIPYAAIFMKQGDAYQAAAEYGLQPAPRLGKRIPTLDAGEAFPDQKELLILPLRYQKETIGQFVLAPRRPGDSFTAADLRILVDIADQVGVLTYTVQISNDLQRSRERLVHLREEERRRLRRDLHDGLGTTLAGLSYHVNAARNLMERDPLMAGELLEDVHLRLQTALADLRHLVYDLRPPALDQLGLVSAIREQMDRFPWPTGLQPSFEALEDLPTLPAAVEVAAYRVILEGLTNVCRHAQATNCCVLLQRTAEDMLLIEIFDDGIGLPEGYHSGVGLLSIQERAAELGGDFQIGAVPSGGTRLSVLLPMAFPEPGLGRP